MKPGSALSLRRGAIAVAFGLLALTSPTGAQVQGSAVGGAEATTVDELTRSAEFTDQHAMVLRMYWAFFNRDPEFGGAKFWLDQFDQGRTLRNIALEFAVSAEFTRTYGSTNNTEFLRVVYQNVLGRQPDQGGFDWWREQLDAGMGRGEAVLLISDSAEFRSAHPYPAPTSEFEGGQFSDEVFDTVSMSGVSFRNANLADALIFDSSFANADFTGATMTDIVIRRSDFREANFTNADLSDALIGGSDFTGAIWNNTTCPDESNSNTNGGTCPLE